MPPSLSSFHGHARLWLAATGEKIMLVEVASYNHHQFMKEAQYIHRFYLPAAFCDALQPHDIAVIYAEAVAMKETYDQTARNIRHYFTKEPFTIRYMREGLVKEIPETLMNIAVRECLRYFREVREYLQSREQVSGLLDLVNMLNSLEWCIYCELQRIYREMVERREEEKRDALEKLERERAMRERMDAPDDSDDFDDMYYDIPLFVKPSQNACTPSVKVVPRESLFSSFPGMCSGKVAALEARPETCAEIAIQYDLSPKHPMYLASGNNIIHRYSETITMQPGFDFETLRDGWMAEIRRRRKKTPEYCHLNADRGWLYSELVHFSEVPLKHICSISNIRVEINRSYAENRRVVSVEEWTRETLSLPHYWRGEMYWPPDWQPDTQR